MVPRILVLILASDDQPYYVEFQKSWVAYMKQYPTIDYYFYKADPNLTADAVLAENTITVKVHESLDNVWKKFLKTLEFCSNKLDDYDFILRPNLSSVFLFNRYLAAAATWPRQQFCTAVVGVYQNGLQFPSGSGFTITPDIAKRLVEESPPEIFWDDVSLGGALRSWGIHITPAGRYDIITSHTCADVPDNVYHIRIKTSDRMADARLHVQLAKRGL